MHIFSFILFHVLGFLMFFYIFKFFIPTFPCAGCRILWWKGDTCIRKEKWDNFGHFKTDVWLQSWPQCPYPGVNTHENEKTQNSIGRMIRLYVIKHKKQKTCQYQEVCCDLGTDFSESLYLLVSFNAWSKKETQIK